MASAPSLPRSARPLAAVHVALALAALLVFPACAARVKGVSAEVLRATDAAMVRDLDSARAGLSEELASKPTDAQALFVLACVELEAGHHDAAEQAIDRLEKAAPGREETAVLRGLLARRRQHPETGWREAFLQAWTERGQPDLSKTHLLPEYAAMGPASPDLGALWRRASSPEARTVLVLAAPRESEERLRWLIRTLPALEDPVLAVLAIDALDASETVPQSLRAEAAEAVRQKLARLVEARPQNLMVRLVSLLENTAPETPFTSEELTALEAAAGLTEWRERTFEDAFHLLRRHLEAAGVQLASPLAFSEVTGYAAGRGPFRLLMRAKASQGKLSPEDSLRLGRVLWQVGDTLAEQTVLVDRMVGLNLMVHGAGWMKDPRLEASALVKQELAREVMGGYQRAALDRWPLRSLLDSFLEASVRDEVGHLTDFATPP